ncbi:response regulator [Spirochaetota bacterium]
MKKYLLFIGEPSVLFKNTQDDLTDTHANLIFADNTEEASEYIKEHLIDIIISDIELGQISGFDLVKQAKIKNPDVQSILVTSKHIEEYFDAILENEIGIILHKPVVQRKMAGLIYKLAAKKDIFELGNTITDVKIHTYPDIKTLNDALQFKIDIYNKLTNNNINQKISNNFIFGFWEIVLNAICHPFGYTDNIRTGKIQAEDISLKKDEIVNVKFGENESQIGASVTDNKGILTKKKVFSAFKNCIYTEKKTDKSNPDLKNISSLTSLNVPVLHSGRGLNMIRRLSASLHINIKQNNKTEVIILYDKHVIDETNNNTADVIIIEA